VNEVVYHSLESTLVHVVRSKRFKVLEGIVRDLPIERPVPKRTPDERMALTLEELQTMIEATRLSALDPNLGGHPNPAIEGHFKTGQR
jgi:hypothetical protein